MAAGGGAAPMRTIEERAASAAALAAGGAGRAPGSGSGAGADSEDADDTDADDAAAAAAAAAAGVTAAAAAAAAAAGAANAVFARTGTEAAIEPADAAICVAGTVRRSQAPPARPARAPSPEEDDASATRISRTAAEMAPTT